MWASSQRVCQTEKTAVQSPWGVVRVGKFQEQEGEPSAARAKEQEGLWRAVWGRGDRSLGASGPS